MQFKHVAQSLVYCKSLYFLLSIYIGHFLLFCPFILAILLSVVRLYWPLSFLLSIYIVHCLFCCPFILTIVLSVVLLYWPLSFLLSFYIGLCLFCCPFILTIVFSVVLLYWSLYFLFFDLRLLITIKYLLFFLSFRFFLF
jgi:hypothetical protein